MLADKECTNIYPFFVQAMYDHGLGDIIAEIEQEIQHLEAVSYADIPISLYTAQRYHAENRERRHNTIQ